MQGHPRLARLLAYAAFVVAAVFFFEWLDVVRFRLVRPLPWIAGGLTTLGLVFAVAAWAERTVPKPALARRTIVPAMFLNAALGAFVGATLLWFLALPDVVPAPATGQAMPEFTAALPSTAGPPMTSADLHGKPSVVVFYRGHW